MAALVEILANETQWMSLWYIRVEQHIRDGALLVHFEERQGLLVEDRGDKKPVRAGFIGPFSRQLIGILVEKVKEERLHRHTVLTPFRLRLLNSTSAQFPIGVQGRIRDKHGDFVIFL